MAGVGMHSGCVFLELQRHSPLQETPMRTAFVALSLIAATPMGNAEGNGDHPALVARRVIAAQGFDHASAFYRHPAGLSLAAHAPGATVDHTAAVTARPAAAEPRRAARRAASRQ
jgi:hypothetical protein